MGRCVFCQGELDLVTHRCRQCGRTQPPLADAAATVTAHAVLLCPACGAPMPSQARFCGACGYGLAERLDRRTTESAHPSSGAPSRTRIPDSPLPPAPSNHPRHPTSVFISYSRADSDFVTRLSDDLQAQGIHIWIDHEGIKPGTPDWEEALRQAIRKAQAIVLVASPHSRQSRYVKDELSVAEMYNHPIFPIWAAGNEWIEAIPLGMGRTQYVDARGAAYQTGMQALIEALKTISSLVQNPPDPLQGDHRAQLTFEPRNPYKGLRAFQAEDARDFFGRSKLVQELLDALQATLDGERSDAPGARLLAVAGPSGSGKSSILLAGLLPRLQQGALPSSKDWIYLAPFTPGAHPFESLAVALSGEFPGRDVRSLLKDLDEESGRGLHLLASALAKRSGRRVVLPIDQFEELFTLTTSEHERKRFLDLLLIAITEPRGPVIILLTLRADFYDRLAQSPELARLIKEKHHLVLPLDVEDLRSVIQGPAALPDVQLFFEGPLVGDLLYEAHGQPGGLPLLQFTLDLLFQRRMGHLLTLTAYRELGGVRGALSKQAEKTFTKLPSDEHRALARALFLRLISLGPTEQDASRRRVLLAELTLPDARQSQQMRQVVGDFVEARLLVSNEQAGVMSLEVSHEALIREWVRLAGWLQEAREDVRLQQRISADAAEWVRRGSPPDRLYRGEALIEAQAWAQRNTPSSEELQFLHASLTAQEEQRQAERTRQERELALQRRALRRQRYVIGLIGAVSLVVAVALIVGLLLQTQLVNTQNALLASLPVSVTTLNDHGAGSLRQAIKDAPAGAAITFSKNLKGTITPTSGELEISKNLSISGPGASQLSISGGNKSRIFTVNSGAIVAISNITITNGYLLFNIDDTLTSDTAGLGGGILNLGTLTLTNCVISHNIAQGGSGIASIGPLTITGSTIAQNKAGNSTDNSYKGDGGGIFGTSTMTITNSAVAENSSNGNGGGIENQATLLLTNSTIYGNTAGAEGGGIENVTQGGASMTCTYCTIYGNTAQSGGGLAFPPGQGTQNAFAVGLLQTSIVANNHANNGPDILGSLSTYYINFIQDASGAAFNPAYDTNYLMLGQSLRLGPLQNNGGPTPTLALLPGSPVIDLIPFSREPASLCGSPDNVLTDQRGYPRPQPQGGACDLGAYEYAAGR